MNYYEHHLGDYAKDTGHLSMLEHGAYRILLDRYYSTEAGIPEGQVYRLARARSEDEKAAVDVVLEEFFDLVDGTWLNQRAEEEIDRFSSKHAESEVRIDNERERVRRHREDRARMFADLRQVGIVAEFNIKTPELRELHKHHCNANVTLHETLQTQSCNVSDTAFHTPVTSSQECVVTPLPPADDNPPPDQPTRRGQLAALLRTQGVDITPANPDLCQWVSSSLTDAEAQEAVDRARLSKPHPEKIPAKYLAAIVPGVIADRDAPSGPLPRGSPSRRKSAGGMKSVEQQNREAAARAKVLLFGDKSNVIEGEVIRE